MRKDILEAQNVRFDVPSESREAAIRRVGQMLVDAGFAKEEYIEGMLQRERGFSTAVESGVAMPHADREYKMQLRRSGVVAAVYPKGIDWNGQTVYLVFGLAAGTDDHLEILQTVTRNLETIEEVQQLIAQKDAQKICEIFS